MEIPLIPLRASSSLALFFELREPLQNLHQFGEADRVVTGYTRIWSELESSLSFTDGILPQPPSFLQDGSAQVADAMIDLHNMISSKAGLLVVCVHLRAIQQLIAVLRHKNVVLSADAPKLLGFQSLTIVCGRGAGSSTQGYSSMRLVVLEYFVRLGIVSIARATNPPLVGDDRTVASVVDSFIFDSVDLWKWFILNADRPISLDWQRQPPPL
jgi:hypothetical protein